MMRIHYILHADFETPGAIEDWSRKKVAASSVSKPFNGEKLPAPDSFDFLIVMGGPQSPLHPDKYPYLKQEIELIKRAVDKEKLVLGFCLGAQLIGEAFGAKTSRSPHKEVGVFPITLTEKGKKDPIFSKIPEKLAVFHWHNDMPGVPKEAAILAESEGCPRQAIRFNDMAYGFQCHLEPKKENVEMMIENCPDDLMPGKYIQSMDDILDHDYSKMHASLHQVLDNLSAKIAEVRL